MCVVVTTESHIVPDLISQTLSFVAGHAMHSSIRNSIATYKCYFLSILSVCTMCEEQGNEDKDEEVWLHKARNGILLVVICTYVHRSSKIIVSLAS